MSDQVYLLMLLLWKHLVCDFFLQGYFIGPYQYKNKGIYGHFGGILHGIITISGTFLVFVILASVGYKFNHFHAGLMLGLEFLIHYHMDYFKIKICKYKSWGPLTSEWFWYMLGIDQFVHMMNYVLIIWVLFG